MRRNIGKVLALMIAFTILMTACGQSTSSGNDTQPVNPIETESDLTTETEVVTETESESEVESQTETESESEVESQTETESEPEVESQTEAETESETESQTEAESESETEPESEEPTYAVTDMKKTMYSTASLNVRSGPSTDDDKIGAYKKGDKVVVTGQVDGTDWYRVDFSGKDGYISGKYIQEEPVKVESTQDKPSQDKPTQNDSPQDKPTQNDSPQDKPTQDEPTQEETTTPPSSSTTSPSTPSSATTAEKKAMMNGLALNPVRSDFAPANEMLDQVFAGIFTDGMTTYDKVKACYDYLADNSSYGQNKAKKEYSDQFLNGYEYEVRTYGLLKYHVGRCYDYSAAFKVMLQAIGLDCRVVYGYNINSSGERIGHAWCELVINGTTYVFDPQIEDVIAERKGKKDYGHFFKTYADFGKEYEKTK